MPQSHPRAADLAARCLRVDASMARIPSAPSTFTAEQLLGARQAAEVVFDEIGLSNYRYDVEPRERSFEVIVEHVFGDVWHDVKLEEPSELLLSAREDRSVRAEIAARWRDRLIPSGS